jgi:hypothetical protein
MWVWTLNPWLQLLEFKDIKYILKLQSISLCLLQLNHMQGWGHLENLNMTKNNVSICSSLLFRKKNLIAGHPNCPPLPQWRYSNFLFFLLLCSPLASKKKDKDIWPNSVHGIGCVCVGGGGGDKHGFTCPYSVFSFNICKINLNYILIIGTLEVRIVIIPCSFSSGYRSQVA